MHYSNMHDCKWVRKRFSEYVDAELSQEYRLRVHNHLRFCEPCSKELELLCKSIALVGDYDTEHMPAVIRTFHLPRSTFIEVFPSIRDDKPTLTSGVLIPYLSALVLFFMVITATITIQQHLDTQYNPSNFVEVFGNFENR